MLRKKLKLEPLPEYLNNDTNIADTLLTKEQELCKILNNLKFEHPVKYVYDPLDYAWDVHKTFIRKYCDGCKKVMFLGINPGPNGMVQTGIPFGEINTVKTWFKISGLVTKPKIECPKKRIEGLDIKTSEVSGKRFWGFFKELCKEPEVFFRNCYVHNYCPLAFLTETGKNLTPNELKKTSPDLQQLEAACDDHLLDLLKLLKTEIIVCIGRYGENHCKKLLKSHRNVKILYLPHPSPRVRTKNAITWDQICANFVKTNELLQYFT